MIDDEQMSLLVYNHVVQLTLIDYDPSNAFRLAYEVAVRAFDPDVARADMDAARKAAAQAAGAEMRPSEGTANGGQKTNASNAQRTTVQQKPAA